eukprot:1422769-Prymnesium_polylepis.1
MAFTFTPERIFPMRTTAHAPGARRAWRVCVTSHGKTRSLPSKSCSPVRTAAVAARERTCVRRSVGAGCGSRARAAHSSRRLVTVPGGDDGRARDHAIRARGSQRQIVERGAEALGGVDNRCGGVGRDDHERRPHGGQRGHLRNGGEGRLRPHVGAVGEGVVTWAGVITCA